MLPIADLRADCEKHLHEIEPSGFVFGVIVGVVLFDEWR